MQEMDGGIVGHKFGSYLVFLLSLHSIMLGILQFVEFLVLFFVVSIARFRVTYVLYDMFY